MSTLALSNLPWTFLMEEPVELSAFFALSRLFSNWSIKVTTLSVAGPTPFKIPESVPWMFEKVSRLVFRPVIIPFSTVTFELWMSFVFFSIILEIDSTALTDVVVASFIESLPVLNFCKIVLYLLFWLSNSLIRLVNESEGYFLLISFKVVSISLFLSIIDSTEVIISWNCPWMLSVFELIFPRFIPDLVFTFAKLFCALDIPVPKSFAKSAMSFRTSVKLSVPFFMLFTPELASLFTVAIDFFDFSISLLLLSTVLLKESSAFSYSLRLSDTVLIFVEMSFWTSSSLVPIPETEPLSMSATVPAAADTNSVLTCCWIVFAPVSVIFGAMAFFFSLR